MAILLPGTRIGQYEIASNPMMGGMGVVYFCLDHANDARPVALKTFKPEYLPDRAARDRFLREGTAWVQLGRHPNIVRCYAVEYIDPTTFLSLELIAKEQGMDDASLRSWLGAPMPVEQALLFALQIARGMKHATEKIPGFVHRDLKPENVLVGADKLPGTNINRLRVTDFGLAAILKNEGGSIQAEDGPKAISRTHLTHGIVGTPLYMAPEQWKGETVGVYTDVYALGCILYEMLTGQRFASGKTIRELQAAHCSGQLRPVLGDDLPGGVQVFLRRGLSLARGERYQDWDEVLGALQSLGIDLPAPAQAEESLAERRDAAASYLAIGMSYAHMGKTHAAIGYYEKVLKISCEVGDRQGEAATLSNLGLAYVDLGDARRAIRYHEEALKIANEIGYRLGQGYELSNLGNVYADLGDLRRAIGYYEEGLVIKREIGGQSRGRNELNNLGLAYAGLGELQHALEYYKEALKIDQKIGDRRGEGMVLNNLGNVYGILGDKQRALGHYEQYLEIAREIADRRGEGIALGNLGLVYVDLGDVQRAIGYYQERIKIVRETGDRRGEGNVLGNLGVAYENLGDKRRAIEHYEEALKIDRETGDQKGEGATMGNLASVHHSLGDVQPATLYYEEAIAIQRKIGDLNGMAINLFNMSNLYKELGKPKQAIPLVQEAERIWTQIGSPNAQRAGQSLAELQGGGLFNRLFGKKG